MQIQYAMVVDAAKCFNCRACVIACQFANEVPSGNTRNWVKQEVEVDGKKLFFQPGNCMHCENPTCVQACPTGATYKDTSDGTVKVDQDLCIRCGSCIPSCPYGARYISPEKSAVDKCNFCEERRARGEEVACVEVCPTRARTFGNIKDSKSQVSYLLKENTTVKVINKKADTRPNIYYISETAPMNWPVEPKAPSPIWVWKAFADIIIKGVVGLSAVGVAIMFGKQLILKDEEPESDLKTLSEDNNG